MNVKDLKGKTVAFFASGGLDSCTITHWLTSGGVKVVSFIADLGQPDEEHLEDVAERMLNCGATEAVTVSLREEMGELGLKGVQAQARYEGNYWVTTPLGRFVTVTGLLPHVIERGIGILSHGATGRGNDQIRFQVMTNMLAPGMVVYAPWRDPHFLDAFGGREEMLAYCAEHKVPIRQPKEALYSTDANLLGLTHEAGQLESLSTAANFVNPGMGVRAADAPDKPEHVTIMFDKGRPIAINGEAVHDAADIFDKANLIGGRNAVGINTHLVENRFVGTKSRGIYEAPGMELLGSAYGYLLQLILDRRARRIFDFVSAFYAEQLYQACGLDFGTQLANEVIERVAEMATGTVTVELYKGNVSFVNAMDVPHSLYIEENASMSNVGDFDHKAAEGFLEVLGVSARALAFRGQVSGVLDVDVRPVSHDRGSDDDKGPEGAC